MQSNDRRSNSILKDKVAKLEQENAELRARIPAIPSDDLSDDDKKMPTELFRARNDRASGPFEKPEAENDVKALARHSGMNPNTAHYHPDRLAEWKLAQSSGPLYGYSYRSLTEHGRAYIVENGLR